MALLKGTLLTFILAIELTKSSHRKQRDRVVFDRLQTKCRKQISELRLPFHFSPSCQARSYMLSAVFGEVSSCWMRWSIFKELKQVRMPLFDAALSYLVMCQYDGKLIKLHSEQIMSLVSAVNKPNYPTGSKTVVKSVSQNPPSS